MNEENIILTALVIAVALIAVLIFFRANSYGGI